MIVLDARVALRVWGGSHRTAQGAGRVGRVGWRDAVGGRLRGPGMIVEVNSG